MRRAAGVLVVALSAAGPSFAQQGTPYTLNADQLEVRRGAGGDTVFVAGHVVFISGSTLLRADRGSYESTAGVGHFEGNVEIFHEESLILGPAADVLEKEETLLLPRGLILIEGRRLALADHAIFYLEEEGGLLWGQVELAEGTRTLAADSLSLTSGDEGVAEGHVVLGDSQERIRVTGEEALLRSGATIVTGHPILLRFDEKGEMESRVSADSLDLETNGASTARGGARIERGLTVAEAGRARIDEDGTTATLEESPRVTREASALTGERIHLRLEAREVREVTAEGAAHLGRNEIIQEEGAEPERAIDDVWGDSLRLEIAADTLRRTVVWGNTHSVTERRALDGAIVERNEVRGDSIILFSESGEAERVRIVGNAEGVYFPRPSERPHPHGAKAEAGKGGAADSAKAEPAPSSITPPDTASSHTASSDTTSSGAAPQDTARADSAGTAGGRADTTAAAPAAGTDSSLAAAAIDSSAIVRYAGHEINFFNKERRIVLTGSSKLNYQEMELTADVVNYDLHRAALVAEGSPVLKQTGEEVEGSRMGYNLDEKQGIVYNGRTHYQTGYLDGGEVVRVNPTTLDVRNGTYTSCDKTPPHYHFASRIMRVYLNDKSVARPVVLYIRGLPVMALPFYILPLSHGRRSGFLLPAIEFGFSDRRGRFVRNLGYYWATNDYMDASFWGDFYQDNSWTANLRSDYALRYRLSGTARASYTREGNGARRWDVQASHNQDLGEKTSLTARADFASDASYRLDQGNTVEDLNRQLKSDISFRRNWTGQTLSLFASRVEELDRGDIRGEYPTLRYTVSRFPILGSARAGQPPSWYGTTYLGLTTNLTNSYDKRVNQITKADSTTQHVATEVTSSLSNSMKLFGWLGLSPSAEYRAAVFGKDNRGDRWSLRSIWSAGASANTNVYGTWRPNIGPVVGLRHIMAPSVSFRYTPDFNQYLDSGDTRDQFPIVSGIGGTPRGAESLGLSLQHTFQVKLKSGEKERSIDDLLLIGQTISRNLKVGDRGWGLLGTSIRLRPVEPFESTVTMSHNLYDKRIENIAFVTSLTLDEALFRGRPPEAGGAPDTSGGATPSDTAGVTSPTAVVPASTNPASADLASTNRAMSRPWSLGFTHNYTKGRPGSRAEQKISARLGMNLTRGWRFDYSPYYDLNDRTILSQQFSLVRDLHCWEARFSGSYFSGGRGWDYFFKINIRVHPDVGYERGRKVF